MSSPANFSNADNKHGQVLVNEPMAGHTSWRAGGTANRLFLPNNSAELAEFLQHLPSDEAILWLGLGSNTLIRDKGFKGTVILTRGKLNGMSLISDDSIRVEAGVSCASMARFCARNHLSGGEFWAGIPGTMGGALRMNAGCHGGETWQVIKEVETITRNGEIRKRSAKEFYIAYRKVSGLEDEWFLSATCQLVPGDKDKSLRLIKELLEHRSSTQPTSEYNCGSVFRNPPGNFAAKLIESSGMKGFLLGDAMVSTKHANFIINRNGQASAENIEALIQLVKRQVKDKTTIELIPEVHIYGETS